MCACANDHIAQIPSVVGKEEMVIHSNIDKEYNVIQDLFAQIY